MKIDITPEILFQTARSGGKGGQNVNKVETMVEGRWLVNTSSLLSEEQKQRVLTKLANKITDDGYLLVKSQTERTQLGNKQEVVRKMHQLLNTALARQKVRRATAPTRASQEKRLEHKKKNAYIKQFRQKINKHDY